MGRAPCCDKAHTNKGAWSKDEDQRLVDYIRVHGEGCWRSLPKAAGLMRCGKSCRLRWINYLRPDLKRGNFTDEDDELIINLHASLGNKWSQIAARMPGRTDNEIKNYWNTHIRRKLLNRGLDPQMHVPLSISENSSSGLTSDDQLVTPQQQPLMLPKPVETTTTTTTTSVGVTEETLDLELSLAVKPSNNQQSFVATDLVNQRHKFCLSCRIVFPQRPSSADCTTCGSPFFRYL